MGTFGSGCFHGIGSPEVERLKKEIITFPEREALSRKAADILLAEAKKSVENSGKFTLALSGGSTPKRLYEILGSSPYRKAIPWGSVHFFWGDERCVPPDHPESNYRMAWETFLSKIVVPRENIHRMTGEKTPAQAALEYEKELRGFFGNVSFPVFDFMLLGLGSDGHIASLFPGSSLLQETRQWVASAQVEKPGISRLTLTLPVFNSAKMLPVLVSGKEKAQIIREIFGGSAEKIAFPAQMIHPENGKLLWLLDDPAASLLDARVNRDNPKK